MKKQRQFIYGMVSFIAAAFLLFTFHGCDTTESTGGTVSLSFSSGSNLQKVNQDVQLTEVKILLKDIKLGKESDSKSGGENGDDDSNYENVKEGPFVVSLNLTGTTTDFAVSNLPAGIYDKLKFEIHKPGGSEVPPDPDFKDGDDNSLRYSVVVKGTIDGNSFVYKSKKSAHQHIRFEPPLEVIDNTNTNLTITVDPNTWFYEDGMFLDPNDPANENDIDNNIKDSFNRCFKDNDHDGDDD
jgi:hypothetical protein